MAAFAFVLTTACEKANVRETTASGAEKQPHKPASPEKTIYISLSTTAGYYCGLTTPCGSTSFSTTKYNLLSVTNNTLSTYSSLVYSYYRHTTTSHTGVETYVPITGAQYTCNLLTSDYASSSLNDGDKILIFANDAIAAGPTMGTLSYDPSTSALTPYPSVAAASTFIITTLGSYKGQLCN